MGSVGALVLAVNEARSWLWAEEMEPEERRARSRSLAELRASLVLILAEKGAETCPTIQA